MMIVGKDLYQSRCPTAIANYTYVLERSTNLLGGWTAIATNTADAVGSIHAADTFSDLSGVTPPQAFYRLQWQP